MQPFSGGNHELLCDVSLTDLMSAETIVSPTILQGVFRVRIYMIIDRISALEQHVSWYILVKCQVTPDVGGVSKMGMVLIKKLRYQNLS